MQLNKKFWNKKKVFVTGHTGFKGSWLCLFLNYLGAEVTGYSLSPDTNPNLFKLANIKGIIKKSIISDVRNYDKLYKEIKKSKSSIIFHLAAQPLIFESYKSPHKTIDINVKTTLNIMEASRLNKFVKSIIIVTSDKCYENSFKTVGFKETDRLGGIDPYSASKASVEIITRAYYESFFKIGNKCGVSTGRAGNVIGGGDWSPNRLIPDCIRSILNKKIIFLRKPNFNRPWQFVLEPIKGYLMLAKKQYENPRKYSGAWNFGTNPKSITSVLDVVKKLINRWGDGKLKFKKSNLYEQENLQLNINKSKKILKWNPTYNVTESVNVTTDWYYEVLKKKRSPVVTTLSQIKKYMNESKKK